MRKILALFLLLLAPTVFALPSITIQGATQKPDGTYYLEVTIPNPNPTYINIENNDTVSYDTRIVVNGNLPMLIKYGTVILGSGTAFTSSYFTIYPQSNAVLTIQYLSPMATTYTTTFTFEFYNVTNNTRTLVGTRSIVLTVKFITQTTQQEQQTTQTGETQTTETTTSTETTCLMPFRTKIKKTLFINETMEISLGVINQCSDTNITLVDVDIEGAPYTIARIKDAQLGTLTPGQIQYIKLVIDTHKIARQTQLAFDVIFTAKKGTKIETAVTNVEVLVLESEEYTELPQEEQNLPPGTLPLQVDYTIEQGYLIIKGAYYTFNNTKVYLGRANIQIISEGSTMTYLYPIKLEPGKTYCISATDPKQEFLPYFKCFSVNKRDLCVTFKPTGMDYNNIKYFPVGTIVEIEKVYDCEDLTEIKDYKLLYDGQLIENRTVKIDNKVHTLVFKAEGYKDKTIKIRGWTPVRFESKLPTQVGNYTITLSGTLADKAKVSIYKIVNGTERLLLTKTGKEISLTLTDPGYYIFKLEAPLQDPKEFKIYIRGVSKEEQPKTDIFGVLKQVILYGLGIFAAFTLISLIIYYRVKKQTLSGAVEELAKIMRK